MPFNCYWLQVLWFRLFHHLLHHLLSRTCPLACLGFAISLLITWRNIRPCPLVWVGIYHTWVFWPLLQVVFLLIQLPGWIWFPPVKWWIRCPCFFQRFGRLSWLLGSGFFDISCSWVCLDTGCYIHKSRTFSIFSAVWLVSFWRPSVACLRLLRRSGKLLPGRFL